MSNSEAVSAEAIKSRIRAYLSQYTQDYSLMDDDDIFDLGLVNSLVALDIITFVEGSFSVSVKSEDIEIANFASITAISKLIDKLSARAST